MFNSLKGAQVSALTLGVSAYMATKQRFVAYFGYYVIK